MVGRPQAPSDRCDTCSRRRRPLRDTLLAHGRQCVLVRVGETGRLAVGGSVVDGGRLRERGGWGEGERREGVNACDVRARMRAL